MWLPFFILLISAAEIHKVLRGTRCFCDEFECFLRENNCDMSTLPKEVPDTVDGLKTICQDMQTLGACSLEVRKNCGYSEEVLAEQQKDMNFLKEVCKEENPIFKVISSNLECIKSASTEFDEICTTKLRNSETIGNFVNDMLEEEDNASVRCLYTLIDVTCPAIVAGHRCDNDDVRSAINGLLGYVRKVEAACPEQAREKLDPIYDTYKSLVLEALDLENEMEARK